MVVLLPDVSLDMPDILDISHLRGTGKLPGEEELADAAAAAAPGSLRCCLVSHQWFVRQSIYCWTNLCTYSLVYVQIDTYWL